MTNLDSILKSRDITLPTKVCLVKAMVFPVVTYGCESWTTKKAECQRIDAFELWCCRRLLRVPWTARRCNQSVLKKISPEYSLEGLMLKLKLQYFDNKVKASQSYDFSSSRVWMWELNYKESWVTKNWCFWTVVLEKTLESLLDCKEIQPDHSEGDQPWDFFVRTNVEVETPILWPPDAKNSFIWKDPDAGKDWRQEEKGTTEDEMVGWHHWRDGHEFE